MVTSLVEADDELKSSNLFGLRIKSNIISEHRKVKHKNLSPLSFVHLLEQAKERHQKGSARQAKSQQTSICKIYGKSKNIGIIGKEKSGASAIPTIFNSKIYTSRPFGNVLPQSVDVADGVNAIDGVDAPEEILPTDHGLDIKVKEEPVLPTDDGLELKVEERKVVHKVLPRKKTQIDVTELRRSERTKKTRLPPVQNQPLRPAEKRTKNMSKHDYNFAQADTVPIGGKQIPGRAYHMNAIDTNFATDTAYRQQLQEMAASMGSLCNIGNSCYMNSVIYTLRYTPLFLHNLHHLVADFAQIFNQKENQQKMKSASLGRNVNGLQGPNARSYSNKDLVSLGSSSSSTVSLPSLEIVKTTQQKASERLHELFQCLSNNENAETTEPYQSDIFLKAIQDVNPTFEGNQQQDAHEFLMCILDSIRETCQSLKKNVIQHPEIIMQGYNSVVDQVDRQLVKPVPSPPQPIVEKKGGWFGKKRKDDKSKNTRVDSPSKELRNSSETPKASSPASIVATHDSSQPMVNGAAGSEASPTSAESVLDKIRELGIDFFSVDFEGVTLASTLCLSCETITEQKEIMIDLSVPITENMETQELDETFIQNLCITRERFQGDNKFRCEKCTGYTEAIRQISYPKLPRLLIIQLKRFSGGMEKINSYIPTPFTLPCFCADCYLKCDGPKDHEYKLYSVITHVGATMCAGHYIAYTCSLNLNSCYQNCAKEAYKSVQAAAAASAAAASAAAIASNTNAASGSNATSGKDSKSSNSSSSSNPVTEGLKKLAAFGRGKHSSSDVSKNQKNCNGIKDITNGVEGIQLINSASSTSPTANVASGTTTNTVGIVPNPCPSINCCSIKMKTIPKDTNSTATNGNNSGGVVMTNGEYPNHSRDGSLSSVYSEHDQFGQVNGVNGVTTTAANSIGTTVNNTEPIWFMCDDDKIKAMPQQEFREMLLPNKKNMITPYLLFYARSDVYQSSH